MKMAQILISMILILGTSMDPLRCLEVTDVRSVAENLSISACITPDTVVGRSACRKMIFEILGFATGCTGRGYRAECMGVVEPRIGLRQL